jgi:transcriptional regulator with XRE-family HTH domain
VGRLEDVARSIAGNVRSERTMRGWTLDELAKRSGVSRRLIVQVEQGQTNPSIATLLRLSDALGVGLPRLVAVTDPPMLHVVRAGDAPVLWRGAHGGSAQLVAGSSPPNVLELWDWTLSPGDVHASEPHSRGTMEQLLVVEGELRLRVADEQQTLRPGDAAAFPGDCPHAYAAPEAADTPARFTLSVLEPHVGLFDAPRSSVLGSMGAPTLPSSSAQ